MKLCPHCNTQNRDSARFCSNCQEHLPLPPGTLLENGRFEIVRELGRGGFGAVYLAQDIRLKRACVVKHLLIPAGASQTEVDDLRRTFQREADALVGLNQPGHPNIPEIYDFFSDTAGNYLVMKYIEGETLQQRLARHGSRLPWKEAVEHVIQVADALVYMHGRQPPVLHRDIKPANILLDATRRVWLVDFGLSKAQPTTGGQAGRTTIAGTAGYTPLEQWMQKAVPVSDVYALGATLHHLITGLDPTLPFDAIDDSDLLQVIRQQHGQFTPVRQVVPSLLPELEAAIAAAVQFMPDHRPTSKEWKTRLEALAHPTGSIQPLTFPQHETATDLASLANCCVRHWEYARRILYDGNGTVEHWLRAALHDPVTADKAQAIVRSQRDQDAGLDAFIRELNPTFPPPRLQVGSASLDAGSLLWQQTRQLTMDVFNTGHGTLQTEVTTSSPWLSVTPATWSCVAGQTARLTVTVDARKLDPGQSYQAQVTLEAGASGRAQVPVTVAVPAPQMAVDPQALDLGSAYLGETLGKTFTVRNTGESAFEGQVSCDQAWASAEPATFRVEPGKSAQVTVTAETGRLSPSTHTILMMITARAGGWNQTADVPVQVHLPRLKTLWHRWATTLDWAALGMLLVAVSFLLPSLFFSLEASLSMPASWALLPVLPVLSGLIGWQVGRGIKGAVPGVVVGALVVIVALRGGLSLMSVVLFMVTDLALLIGFIGWRVGRGARGAAAGAACLVGGLLASTQVDLWLGLAPAVALAIVVGGLMGSIWGLRVKSKRRRRSGILAVAVLALALIGIGYASSQPHYWWRQIGTLKAPAGGNAPYIAFSPDGATLAVSNQQNKTVRLQRVSDGATLQILTGDEWTDSVAFSPDGAILASGSYTSARLWRVSDGTLVQMLPIVEGYRADSVTFSPDGTLLASGSCELDAGRSVHQTVRLWRVSDGVLLYSLGGSGRCDDVQDAAFSPDGALLASGGGNEVYLWQVATGTRLRRLEWAGGWVTSLAFSPDGATLAAGNEAGVVQLWRVSDGTRLHTLKGSGEILDVAFSPDGTLLASAGAEVRLWRVGDGALLRALVKLQTRDYVSSVAFRPDGAILAMGGDTVRLWRVGAGRDSKAARH